MKNSNLLKIPGLYLLLIFVTNNLAGICQTTNPLPSQAGVLNISLKAGDTLPSTGMKQMQPRITHVATVAPDILCIEIDACHILPSIQIPYQPDSTDVVTVGDYNNLGETRSIYVVRNGFPLGSLVGKDRKIIMLYERIAGKHLNTNLADKSASYLISSPTDHNYIKTIIPEKVWRKTKPTNWTTYREFDTVQFYSAKHYLYLKLPHPLFTGHAYLVRLPDLKLSSSSFYYVHDPAYIRSDAVHASQIGFRTDDPDKIAFLSAWMGNGGGYSYPENLEFFLINDESNEKVFNGKVVLQWKGSVPEGIGTNINHSRTDVMRMDFGNFNKPGRYRISVEGIGCSYPFNIDEESTWKHAFEISMKGHFNHRSGIPMLPPYTDFVRPRSFHPMDNVKVYQSTCSLLNSGNGLNALGTDKDNFGNLVAGKTDELVPEAWGGTMDAGDWDRRINHLYTPRHYLELVELNPGYFKNLCLYIPESGNDLPDVVDEALYGLDIYRRMQLPDGGIRGGVESAEHPAEGTTSWQEVNTVLAYAPDHWSSYIYAGVAARAALVLKLFGKNEMALIWEKSAVKAMEWAEIEYEKWITSSQYPNVRERAKRTVPAERNLAAVELYRLTQNTQWHHVYLLTQEHSGNDAAFIYARLDQSLVNRKARKNAVDKMMAEAEQMVELSANNAFGITTGLPDRPLGGWSSTYTIPASSALVRAHYLSADPRYLKAILRSAQYSAGANPMNLCLTTGLGENSVQNALHEDTRHTGQPAPIGISVFGPSELAYNVQPGSNLEIKLNAECTPEISNWPTAESFFDIFWFVSQNEYVIDRPLGQAAYIWGYLASRKKL
ncbi:MAG: glycoside hydrolase family 9 protein [Cyclobacteriaceae bacterium]|nr:glycoside hydrolase family 9 protein [Cyclobacteriaceae bacterium]